MDNHRALFGEYCYCKECQKLLPTDYELDICQECVEYSLFKQVREYIRENDVTEYDVADAFDLPLKKVQAWIREGRIQYKEDKNRKIIGHHCIRCGSIILKGQYCPNCRNILKNQKVTVAYNPEEAEDSRMRYLDDIQAEE